MLAKMQFLESEDSRNKKQRHHIKEYNSNAPRNDVKCSELLNPFLKRINVQISNQVVGRSTTEKAMEKANIFT